MAITESTIGYTRSPLVPTEADGRMQYVINELDKIVFTISNLQSDINALLVSLDERIAVLEGP